ncbi:LCP family protein [Candidatus Daviesbacteria bacterium]|nr:LCP family protein [Candidatus Daviesbacteria bacterium]
MKNLNASLGARKSRGWSSFFRKKKTAVLASVGAIIFAIAWVFIFQSSTVFDFAFGGPLPLSSEGRVNILLLGIGGGTHEGATLTDTVMLASYDPKTHRVDLISIPRDLWLTKFSAKVNTLYQTGLLKGNSLKFAETEIGNILGTQIPYALRVDFSGFVKAVDLVGGIDVDVQNTFDDWQYPIEGKEDDLCGYSEQQMTIDDAKSKELGLPLGQQQVFVSPDGHIATDSSQLSFSCRFEHIHFDKGQAHMSGATALKFVRSRHGTGLEGSDFARSKRQQVVLQAFRNKVLSTSTLLDPSKIVSLAQTFGASISTDIPQVKYVEFIQLIKSVTEVRSHVIDFDSDSQLLIHPSDSTPYGGAWVVIPPNNDFTNVQSYVNDVFAGKAPASPSAQIKR